MYAIFKEDMAFPETPIYTLDPDTGFFESEGQDPYRFHYYDVVYNDDFIVLFDREAFALLTH